MSTILQATEKCAICGSKNNVQLVCSTNSFGPPDLDLRPAPMARYMIGHMIHECQNCGYVSYDLKKCNLTNERVKEIMNSEDYKTALQLPDGSTAQKYYRLYLLMLEENDTYGTFTSLLRAVWEAEDILDNSYEIRVREVLISLIEQKLHGLDCDHERNEREQLTIMLAECHRKCHNFEEAKMVLSGKTFESELLNKIAAFIVKKSEDRDANPYNVGHVTFPFEEH